MKKRQRFAGFTMVELMFVVAVVGILAAIALPSYNESVRKSRRTQVKADLQEIQQNMERFFTLRNTYVGFVLGPLGSSPRGNGPKAFYSIRFSAGPTAVAYTLTAVPTNAQVSDRCGTYTLDQAGTKTAAETDCW